MALQKLFGSKAGQLDYMFLGNISTSFNFYNFLHYRASAAKEIRGLAVNETQHAKPFWKGTLANLISYLASKMAPIQTKNSSHLVIPRNKWNMFDKDTISLKRKVGFHCDSLCENSCSRFL